MFKFSLDIALCLVTSIFSSTSVGSPVFSACQLKRKPSLAPSTMPLSCAAASPGGILPPNILATFRSPTARLAVNTFDRTLTT